MEQTQTQLTQTELAEKWKKQASYLGKVIMVVAAITVGAHILFYANGIANPEDTQQTDLLGLAIVTIFSAVMFIMGNRLKRGPDQHSKKQLITVIVTLILFALFLLWMGGRVGIAAAILVALAVREMNTFNKLSQQDPSFISSLPAPTYTLKGGYWALFALGCLAALVTAVMFDPATKQAFMEGYEEGLRESQESSTPVSATIPTSTLWKEVVSSDKSFTVRFPETPEAKTEDFPLEGFKNPGHYEEFALDIANKTFYVSQTSYPAEVDTSKPRVNLENAFEGFSDSLGGKAVSSEFKKFNGNEAIEFEIEAPEFTTRGWVIMKGKKLYQIFFAYPKDGFNAEMYSAFIGSFKIK